MGCSRYDHISIEVIIVLVPAMYVGCSYLHEILEKLFEMVLVPTMHVSCSCYHKIKQRCYVGVLVPTMHVGCS